MHPLQCGVKGFQPAQSVDDAMYPMEHVAFDLGDFNVTTPRGVNFFLVYVCVATRFVILRALQDKQMTTIAWELWEIFCLFGPPKIMQSDRGPEFVNKVLEAMATLCGVDHRLIASYNPRANGLAENYRSRNQPTVIKRLVINLISHRAPIVQSFVVEGNI